MQAISQRSGVETDGVTVEVNAPSARAPRIKPPAYPGLAAALVKETADRVSAAAHSAVHRTAAWRLSLRGPLPHVLAIIPDALTPVTLEGAQDVLRGRFPLEEGVIDVRGGSPFDAPVDRALLADLHRFEWLGHLEKAGGKTAHFVARALVEDWIARFRRYDDLSWQPHVLGARLVQWAAHFRFLVSDNDLIFRSRLLKTMGEQLRHLARTSGDAPPGLPRITAAAALMTMDAAIPENEGRPLKAAEMLSRALDGFILPDGGIITRSPRDQMRAVADVLRASRALADGHRAMPPFLPGRLNAMRVALAAMRHGDGRLSCFHGSDEGQESFVGDLCGGLPPRAQPLFLPGLGYARLATRHTTALFDTGGAPPGPHAAEAHAAPLSFEFSHDETRIIVNGGTARRRGADWRGAARHTAAHATLELNEHDAGHMLTGPAARRLGPRLYGINASGTFESNDLGLWAEGQHDGWRTSFGVTHHRRLFLDATGNDLRGEDHLIRQGKGRALDVAIRFPLHPDCKATMAHGGDSVLIAPHGGEAWRFRAGLEGHQAVLTLEDGIYMGGERPRKTSIIVIRAAVMLTDWTMRWALRMESGFHRPRRRLV